MGIDVLVDAITTPEDRKPVKNLQEASPLNDSLPFCR